MRLDVVDSHWVVHHLEEVVEESGKFISVQSARPISVILVEHLVDVLLQLAIGD